MNFMPLLVLLSVSLSPISNTYAQDLSPGDSMTVSQPSNPNQESDSMTVPQTANPSQQGDSMTAPQPASSNQQGAGVPVVTGTTTSLTGKATLSLTSPAFTNGGNIPEKYTCHGANISPPLNWSGAATNKVKSFALVVVDRESSSTNGQYINWLVYNIPGTATNIPEGGIVKGAIVGLNSKGQSNYIGPCPTDQPHHYYFLLYSLDIELPQSGLNFAGLSNLLTTHSVAQSTLIGMVNQQQSVT